MTSSLERARAAFARQAWGDARSAFAAAAERAPLDADDLERLAVAAYLVGEDAACDRAWEAAHRSAVDAADPAAAARCAVLLALCLVLRGQMAQASGWLARADGLLEASGVECAASGYVMIPRLLGALDAGDAGTARDLAVRATALGEQFDDADLGALGVLGHGQALIAMGETREGTARFDEVMLAVTSGEVGPIVAGIAYCAVIIECLTLFDLARASEWTGALSDWCDAQPDLVPYRGQCLVHRSQLHQAAGRWTDALTTAAAACRHLADPPHPALGLAYYQEAELHRLTGRFESAEAEYRRASRHGHDPMPGLALLELARGHADAAASAIRRALGETSVPLERPALLAAAVDILRAAGNLAEARAAADELTTIAAMTGSEVLVAMAAQATGVVLLGEGDPTAALAELRTAVRAWQSLHMPHESARTAVHVGLACAALGDVTAAAVELDNAGAVFAELDAGPDLARLAALRRGLIPAVEHQPPAGLTGREREVLTHLAAGRTNREIAAALVLSQHTVRRHVENIFAKLGVSTRAAATAYAYEHGLLQPEGPS